MRRDANRCDIVIVGLMARRTTLAAVVVIVVILVWFDSCQNTKKQDLVKAEIKRMNAVCNWSVVKSKYY